MNVRISFAPLLMLFVAGCGSTPPAAPSSPTTTAAPATSGQGSDQLAKEGESCGNGVMGAPNIQCAEGLVCDFGAGTAPNAPPGAQGSAKPGTCKKK